MNDSVKGRIVNGERKERRGFASMSPEKQREIASKGGRAAHQKGTAHEWTSEEARSAGRKGGQISRGGRGRLVEGPTAGPPVTSGRPPIGGGVRRAVDWSETEACAYVETGNDGDSRGTGGCDGVCTDDVHGWCDRPAANGDVASDRPDNGPDPGGSR